MRAFIHTVGGMPFNEECASAWRGFETLGVEVVPFSNVDRLKTSKREDVVVGGMLICGHALARYGLTPPAIDYPNGLHRFLVRKITTAPAGSLRAEDLPAFVKPAAEKDLPGAVISSMSELEPYLEKGEDYPLLVSEPVRFVSEWRCFVRYRRILGARHYRGSRLMEPDWLVARDIIGHYYPGYYTERPNGYGIDLGVTDDGRTLLVEINDGFALGSYGLDDVAYALMLSARWSQLMRVDDGLHDAADPEIDGPIAAAVLSQRWHDYRFGKPGESIPESEPDLPRWVWGVAANVREYPLEKTAEQVERMRKGTNHFAPGTRVWVMEQHWSWDERLAVVGKEKGTRRYIRKVMDARELESFRAKRVYSPTIISWMRGARSNTRNYSHCGKYASYGESFDAYWDRKGAEEFARRRNEVDADSY